MKPGAGKSKGNQFERDCHKRLSKWIGFDIRRNSDSGSVTKRDNTLIPYFPYTFEFKFYHDLPLEQAIYDGIENTKIWKWILQSREGIDNGKLLPIVVAKQNFREPVCFLTKEALRVIEARAGETFKILCIFPSADIFVISFEELLKVPFESVKRKEM